MRIKRAHTCYRADVLSTHALVISSFGVFYSLSSCKALGVALALCVEEHIFTTCKTECLFSNLAVPEMGENGV